jgi:hypothetical protein
MRAVANAEHEFYADTLGQLPQGRDFDVIGGLLSELDEGRSVPMPDALPDDEEACLDALRDLLEDRVTLVTFWMSRLFPAKYILNQQS